MASGLTIEAWIAIVSSFVTLVSFGISSWIWFSKEAKVDELKSALKVAHDIVNAANWERHMLGAEDSTARIAQLEHSLGVMASVVHVTGRYCGDEPAYSTEFGALVERGVIITTSMVWAIESGSSTQAVWIATPDLEPDASESRAGAIIRANLRRGRSYVYFIPDDLDQTVDVRLKDNIGIESLPSRLRSNLEVIRVPREEFHRFFDRGNTVAYFRKLGHGKRGAAVLEELVLTKVAERGAFWQEHGHQAALTITEKLSEWHTSSGKKERGAQIGS